MAQKLNIERMRVASPCHVGWDSMHGDDRTRACGGCERNVYNIVGLSRGEIESLVQTTEGRLCVRMYQRADDTVLTQDCPVGLRAVRKRVATLAGAVLSALLGLVSVGFGQKADNASLMNVKTAKTKVDSEKGEISGFVVDPNGAVFPGVEVELREKKRKLQTVKTDSEGAFKIEGISPGLSYHLVLRFPGFKKARIEKFEVVAGQKLYLEILLETGREIVVGMFGQPSEFHLAKPTQPTGTFIRRQTQPPPIIPEERSKRHSRHSF